MIVNEPAQLQRQRILHPVINALAVFAARENARGREQGKMLRHIGLGRARRRDDVADGAGPTADGLEDFQARRFAEHAEMQGDAGQFAVGKETFPRAG